MVKADPKHDYYADLELPSTADSETIKRQFRHLAKLYHPDRNPGREAEVVEKFQAIQAANEILSDPLQKKGYDRDRTKQSQTNESTETTTFKKPAKPPPPASPFPPPPKRDPNLNRPRFANSSRPSSASAEKFAQFTRAAPQQWDRAKFEDAAKAETLRNLNNMRGHSQGPPPRPPPRAPPTAPKQQPTAPSPDMPYATGPPPGFPGLSRTNSGRRGAFTPGTPVTDEPPTSSSAYAHVHRSDRPPPATGYAYPQNHAGPTPTPPPPPMQRSRHSESPLRQSKSSGFETLQPGIHRTSSRYAGNSGERTDINGPSLARSASVRSSPTRNHWDDAGPSGGRPQSQQQTRFKTARPRHHSSSPRGRAGAATNEYSGSETSSSEDEPPRNKTRQKATPRKPQEAPYKGHQPFTDDDPALTGQFPRNNYNTKKTEENQYHYPAPESNGTPYRRAFSDSVDPVDNLAQGMSNAGIRHVHRDDVPSKKYENPLFHSAFPNPWKSPPGTSTYKSLDYTINGIPAWALPSSVYPDRAPLKANAFHPCSPMTPVQRPSFSEQKIHHPSENHLDQYANMCHSPGSQRFNNAPNEAQSASTSTQQAFQAADWDGKFGEGDNVFRPTDTTSRSRSPTKQTRPKLPNRNRNGPRSQEGKDDNSNVHDESSTRMPGIRHVTGIADGLGKAAAFQAGNFSTENWGEKLRSQSNGNIPKAPVREAPPPPPSTASSTQPNFHDEVEVEEHPSPPGRSTRPQETAHGPDAMDIDESTPQTGAPLASPGVGHAMPHLDSSRRPSSNGINLSELGETTPFKPTATGLNDLGDLNDTLPFESRAAEELNLHQPPSSGPAARHLRLPTPPKPVLPPDEMNLSQESWSKYSQKMTQYMDAWNIFNCKMIDHFRTRQQQITLATYHNWVTARGDGASADDFDGLDFVGSDVGSATDGQDEMGGGAHIKHKKAGYATYMQWLKQDRVCRTWWEVAFDEHMKCMEDLGRVRTLVKSIGAKEARKTP